MNRNGKKKKVVRLNESQLGKIVSESVKKILQEQNGDVSHEMSLDGQLAMRILNFVNPYIPEHIREECLSIIRKEKRGFYTAN